MSAVVLFTIREVIAIYMGKRIVDLGVNEAVILFGHAAPAVS